jgi:uncharacterized protein YjbI with pentapeptide repeats
VSTCDYEYKTKSVDFKCSELVHNRDATHCMFHDTNYLKGDNYEKNKEKVASGFKRKLLAYNSNDMPLEFFGYCLPDISFENEEFSKEIYFNDATLYVGNFIKTKFSKAANFHKTTFYGLWTDFTKDTFPKGADFSEAIFYGLANFSGATFSEGTFFMKTIFSNIATFEGTTFSALLTSFRKATFSNNTIFRLASFSQGADFIDAGFSGVASYTKAKFSGVFTNFGNATFSKQADFGEVIFSSGVSFTKAKFSGI